MGQLHRMHRLGKAIPVKGRRKLDGDTGKDRPVCQPKKRNDRALMLARQRRHIRVGGITEHYPKKKFVDRTTCSKCGIKMSYDEDRRGYIIG